MDRVERLQQLLQTAPKDNFLRHALALEFIKLGNEEKARELFESILTEFPEYIGSYYHLGKLLERIGKPEQAIDWYQKGMNAARQAGDRHALGELQGAYDELAY